MKTAIPATINELAKSGREWERLRERKCMEATTLSGWHYMVLMVR